MHRRSVGGGLGDELLHFGIRFRLRRRSRSGGCRDPFARPDIPGPEVAIKLALAVEEQDARRDRDAFAGRSAAGKVRDRREPVQVEFVE